MESTLFDCQVNSNSGGIDSLSTDDNGSDWYDCDDLEYNDLELIQSTTDKVFCFETDHAALRGNSDYHNLIKALAVLEAQRIKTVEDIEKLENLRIKVRKDPNEYLKKFLSGDISDIPSQIEVQQVPKIDWSKYRVNSTDDGTSSNPGSYQSRVIKTERQKIPEREGNDTVEDTHNNMTVRGRMFDQSKPQTFNQLWTAEEQLRLEELLLEFPPERKENNRWRKIAQALGNRTTKQVCSRVQKYFKKLNEAGLPIPGHHLKTSNMTSTKKKIRRPKKPSTRDSTFFPTQHLGAPQHLDGCEEDDIKTAVPGLTIELKEDIVNKVIEFKTKDGQLPSFSHPGIKCTICAEMPLQGTRWHCLLCQNVNLCSDCVIGQLSALEASHPPSHPLEPLSNPNVTHWDPDYMPDSFQSNNYLDPNFVTTSVL